MGCDAQHIKDIIISKGDSTVDAADADAADAAGAAAEEGRR